VKNITYNGNVFLWDCLDGAITTKGKVTYNIYYIIHYCTGSELNSKYKFVVKYLPEPSKTKPEDPETPPQFSPPHLDNSSLESATAPPNFAIIPNPNTGTFQLETNFPLSNIGNLKVTNFLGVTIYETQNVAEHTIQLQNTASGMFFVVMILKDGSVLTQKMMVQR